MKTYKISAVSYANTLPFIYGLQHSDIIKNIDLYLDPPAECAAKLINGNVDISLLPVAVLPYIKDYQIVTDFCIGAEAEVRTVVLLSNVPLNEIKNIYLDYQSRTSIQLVKVLAKKLGKIAPAYTPASPGYEDTAITGNNAAVIIGDRVFTYENTYKYKYDLAAEWIKLTGLPFVFACWASNKPIDIEFIAKLNKALAYGVNNIEAVIDWQKNNPRYKNIDLLAYYKDNIKYPFTEAKKQGMELFLKYIK